MLVGFAFDEPLVLKRVEAVDHRFIGDDPTGGLDFSDEGPVSVLGDVLLNEREDLFLLVRQSVHNRRL